MAVVTEGLQVFMALSAKEREKGLKSTKFTWAEVVLDLIPEMASSN